MRHSRARVSRLKPDWRTAWGLHPDFPLFPLPRAVAPGRPDGRRWAKKINGRLHYFGKVADDPQGTAALAEWLRVKDALIAGRPRPPKNDQRLTLRELCNRFLAAKRARIDLGELSPRTFYGYTRTTDVLIGTLGRDVAVADLGPADFARLYARLARQHGLTTLGREVTTVRSIFKHGLEAGLLERVVLFGPAFRPPSKAVRRRHKAQQKRAIGPRLFSADEVQRMLAAAGRRRRCRGPGVPAISGRGAA